MHVSPHVSGPKPAPPHVHVSGGDAALIRHQERLLRMDEVESLTGLKKSSLYALMRTDALLRPVRLTRRTVAWPESRVQSWIQARIAESDHQQVGAA